MRQVVLAAVVACCGCTAVLGLDERERASDEAGSADVDTIDSDVADSADEDSSLPEDTSTDTSAPRDTSVPPDTASPPDTSAPPDTTVPPDTFVPPDTATPPDTFMPPMDTAPADTSSPPCPFFGLSCASGQDCIVTENAGATTTTYSFACADPPLVLGGACSPTLKCPEGFGCRTGYPSGTKCVPLCTSAAMCTAPYSVCAAVTWSGASSSTAICDTCDPVNKTGCSGTTRCGVGTPDTPPTCRPSSDFGGRNAGASCPSADLCETGTVCACATGFGIDSCPSGGSCVALCNTNADCIGKFPGSTTCKALKTGSSYKGCLP
jgi:hypothetical protein